MYLAVVQEKGNKTKKEIFLPEKELIDRFIPVYKINCTWYTKCKIKIIFRYGIFQISQLYTSRLGKHFERPKQIFEMSECTRAFIHIPSITQKNLESNKILKKISSFRIKRGFIFIFAEKRWVHVICRYLLSWNERLQVK